MASAKVPSSEIDLVQDHYPAWVGGSWRHDGGLDDQELTDPSTGEVMATVANVDGAAVDAAVDAGLAAQPSWWSSGWEARAAVLHRIADDLEGQAEAFARLDARNGGIAIRGARRDVANAVRYLRYYAGLASELKGRTLEASQDTISGSFREPYRVVGRIVPFNHPLQFAVQAVAAPLAAGNSVVLKPAEQTPASALQFAALADRHLPTGLLSVLPGGREVGGAIVDHPDIPRIGFTGSVSTGRAVLRQAAAHIKVVTLELGGKNPMIVGADVPAKVAAEHIVTGLNLLRTAGQSCGSTSRVYVHASRFEETQRLVVDTFGALRLGHALDEDTDVGPLISRTHQQRVLSHIQAAADEGVSLLAGGHCPADLAAGFFVAPTVLCPDDDAHAVVREELFAPVVSLHRWEDEDDVIARANALPLGLTANVVTNDLSAAVRFARHVDAGYVWINGRGQRPLGSPFGGFKQSGLGEENTLEELLSYTRTKNVNLAALPRA